VASTSHFENAAAKSSAIFRRTNNVRRDGVFRVRQRHRHQGRSRTGQHVQRLFDAAFDLGVHARLKVFFGHPHAQARHPRAHGLDISPDRRRDGRRVERIVPGDDFQ
jgi:hypothetical protein